MKKITKRTFNKARQDLNETINYLLEKKALFYDIIKDDIENREKGLGKLSDYSLFVLEHIKSLDIAIESLEDVILRLTKDEQLNDEYTTLKSSRSISNRRSTSGVKLNQGGINQ